MKYYRLLGILLLLENHPVLTAKEIAAHFEVSIRTVYRDLEVLSEAGYGIVTESGKGGGISLQYNKRVRVSAMDEHELIKLVRQFALKSDDASYENIGLKIRSQLPPEAQLVYDRLIAVTLVDNTYWSGKASTVEAYVLSIQEAILKNRKLIIDYTSGSGFTNDRIIWPLGIVKKAQQQYLVAYCEKRMENRTFNVDKISRLTISDETYEPLPSFDLKAFWMNQSREYKAPMTRPVTEGHSDAHYPVTLRVNDAGLDRLKGFRMIQMEDDHQITLDFISENIAFNHLILMSEMIRVMRPEALIQKFRQRASQILEQYGL